MGIYTYLIATGYSGPGSFDLAFLLKLRYVNKTSTLVELIKKQHDGLENVPSDILKSILQGETKYRVLLMLDGYDEYTPGTNRDIDKAIESTIGNCVLIITSRRGNYISKETRDKMDGEIIIEGLSESGIRECSSKYLGSKEKSLKMLHQAKETGIYVLLYIPIILVMTVVVFMEEDSLPRTKTGIYETIFRLAMDRTTLKTFGRRSEGIEKLEELLYLLENSLGLHLTTQFISFC